MKQILIYVILRPFSQNCERDSIGEVSSFGEYGFLSGHVSATGGGEDPYCFDSLPACLVWPGFVLKLPLIHRSWSVEFLQRRAFQKVDFLKARFRFLLVRWSL